VQNAGRIPINIPDGARSACVLAAFLYFLLLCVLMFVVSSRAMPPTGDEPHYLIVAHSLALDRDISLLNNYQKHHYYYFYPGELAKRTTPSADQKRELPAQGLGLSGFLAPFYYLTMRISPRSVVAVLHLVMCSTTAIVLYNVLILLFQIRVSSFATWLVTLGAFLASPILTYSSLFYPEIPAFLLMIFAIRQILEIEEHRWISFFWLSLIPGALVWLHPKYFALAICICVTAAIWYYKRLRVYRDGSHHGMSILYLIASFASIFSFFVFLNFEYGGWSPNRIYAGWDRPAQNLLDLIRQQGIARIGTMIRMVFGFWIDQRFGLISHAPLYVLFFPASIWMFRSKSSLKFLLIWFVIHFLIICWGAPLGGFAPPSRHMIVLLPLILIPIAFMVSGISGFKKYLAVGLFVLSWFFAVLMFLNFRSLFSNVTWRNPDGVSPFWQNLKLDWLIPNLTATQPNWILVIVWCIGLCAISWLLYPRIRRAETNP
jgi:hypothetical protein